MYQHASDLIGLAVLPKANHSNKNRVFLELAIATEHSKSSPEQFLALENKSVMMWELAAGLRIDKWYHSS